MPAKLATVLPVSVTEPEELLVAEVVAKRLNLPPSWVRRNIPALRLGRYVRWRWADVQAWLREQETR